MRTAMLLCLALAACGNGETPAESCAALVNTTSQLAPKRLCKVPESSWPLGAYPIDVEGEWYSEQDGVITAGPVFYSPTLHTGLILETPSGCQYFPCGIE